MLQLLATLPALASLALESLALEMMHFMTGNERTLYQSFSGGPSAPACSSAAGSESARHQARWNERGKDR